MRTMSRAVLPSVFLVALVRSLAAGAGRRRRRGSRAGDRAVPGGLLAGEVQRPLSPARGRGPRGGARRAVGAGPQRTARPCRASRRWCSPAASRRPSWPSASPRRATSSTQCPTSAGASWAARTTPSTPPAWAATVPRRASGTCARPRGRSRRRSNIEAAWAVTTGSPDVVVAAVDTGVRYEHPDLLPVAAGGHLLPGYDMISDAASANDGDGRDADASDPGDWLTRAEHLAAGQLALSLHDIPVEQLVARHAGLGTDRRAHGQRHRHGRRGARRPRAARARARQVRRLRLGHHRGHALGRRPRACPARPPTRTRRGSST